MYRHIEVLRVLKQYTDSNGTHYKPYTLKMDLHKQNNTEGNRPYK